MELSFADYMNNHGMLDDIKVIAAKVRKWAEKRPLYDDNLCGLCAIASVKLYKELAKSGINSTLHLAVHDNDHVFVKVSEYIVDVTATQYTEFTNTKVNILHEREAEQYNYYNSIKEFKTPSELTKYQTESGWPSDEIAK